MITQDGKEIKKGDKVWTLAQDGWHEVIAGEPIPWAPNFIAKPRYCWASKEARNPSDSIKAVLDCGTELLFNTLDHNEVHDQLKKMNLAEEEYTIHFCHKSAQMAEPADALVSRTSL